MMRVDVTQRIAGMTREHQLTGLMPFFVVLTKVDMASDDNKNATLDSQTIVEEE